MFGIRKSAALTIVLIIIALASTLFGGTWFSLGTGLLAIFAGLWWVGDFEAGTGLG